MTVRGLLEDRHLSGLDINCRDEGDRTPLIWASARGNTEIVELLLACDEIQVWPVDDIGCLAVHWSAKHGYPNITQMLLRKRAFANVQIASTQFVSLVACWEPFQGVLAVILPKIGRIRHYYFFYCSEPLFYFWPFLAHENQCVTYMHHHIYTN